MYEMQYMEKEQFYKLHEEIGQFNITEYYKYIPEKLKGKKLLDIGCGEGNDLAYFRNKGAEIYGIDINTGAVKIAQERFSLNEQNIMATEASTLDFPDFTFDVITSNYVLQSIEQLDPVFNEIARVLKPGGEFIFLATHPMRQYFEKKNPRSNYFKREIVDSVILNNTVVVQEPTHTMNDYMSNHFLESFYVEKYIELHDPTAEKVEGREYPGFFIVRAIKK